MGLNNAVTVPSVTHNHSSDVLKVLNVSQRDVSILWRHTVDQ